MWHIVQNIFYRFENCTNCLSVTAYVSQLSYDCWPWIWRLTSWRLNDWIGLSSVLHPREHIYGRRFLQVKRPNQQYQSTEGTYNIQITEKHTYNKKHSKSPSLNDINSFIIYETCTENTIHAPSMSIDTHSLNQAINQILKTHLYITMLQANQRCLGA